MEILLYILIGLIAIICIFLLLPVSILLKNDEQNNFIYKIKFLWFSFPQKKVKSGKHIAEKPVKTEKPSEKSLMEKIKDSKELIIASIKEISSLIKKFTIKEFHLDILCSGKNAAETAIKYGACCSLVYPLTSFIDSLMKPKYKKQKINIRSNFESKEEHIKFELKLSVKIISLLIALIKIAIRKAKAL